MAVTPEHYARIPRLFHFTDRRNLPSIREHGGIYSRERLERMTIEVAAPGGDEASQASDRSRDLHTYVHLCFVSNHPMEFRAREAGRISQSIFLEIDPRVLEQAGVKFVPGMANTNGIPIHDFKEAIVAGRIDFDALYTWLPWADPVIQTRRQTAEKYEILVPDFISIELIRNLPNG